MKKEYDFSKGTRGAVLAATGKTRITLYLDDLVLARFRIEAERSGKGYQTLINEALNRVLGLSTEPLTSETVRAIVREELAAAIR
jgi:uncharacterized protein (DUF4415 family)